MHHVCSSLNGDSNKFGILSNAGTVMPNDVRTKRSVPNDSPFGFTQHTSIRLSVTSHDLLYGYKQAGMLEVHFRKLLCVGSRYPRHGHRSACSRLVRH